MSMGIAPDEGLTETWTWQTDIITTWNGTESRLSLRDLPRVQQSGEISILNSPERVQLVSELAAQLNTPSVYPLWAWTARVNGSSIGTGTTTVQADTRIMCLAEGDYVSLLDRRTNTVITGLASSVSDTEFVIDTEATITTDWLASKAMTAILDNNPSINWGTVAGRYRFDMNSFIEPEIQRVNTAAVLTTLDGFPILDKTVLEDAEEQPEYVREITDFGGARTIGTRYPNMRINGNVSYLVDRFDLADIDFWRLFLDTVKGSWKAFLASTQRSDFTLASPLVQNGNTISTNQSDRDATLQDAATYQYIRIYYADKTTSDHQITNFSASGVITIADTLPNDPKVANVDRISYLLKMRMGDRVRWTHGSRNSILSMGFTTTNDG